MTATSDRDIVWFSNHLGNGSFGPPRLLGRPDVATNMPLLNFKMVDFVVRKNPISGRDDIFASLGHVYVWKNLGNGSFSSPLSLYSGSMRGISLISIGVGDFNQVCAGIISC